MGIGGVPEEDNEGLRKRIVLKLFGVACSIGRSSTDTFFAGLLYMRALQHYDHLALLAWNRNGPLQ
eukprot:4928598-Amphidinium_carterae.1